MNSAALQAGPFHVVDLISFVLNASYQALISLNNHLGHGLKDSLALH